MTKQTWTAAVAALLFVALAALIAMVPVPFVTWSPGSTYNLLGDIDGQAGTAPAIRIQGIDTFPASGEVRMATVSVTRPDSALTLPEALFSYWLPSREVMPRDAVYPPGIDATEIQDQSVRLMDDSQSTAVVAALRVAGVPVLELPMVTWVSAAGPAHEKLKPGDLITAVDNAHVQRVDDVKQAIAKQGVGKVVKFDLERDGLPMSVTVTTRPSSTDAEAPAVGITLDVGYKYAPTISFGIDPAIGGPSAGLPFAMAIYELLTPDSVLAGRVVAGTGEIDSSGRVSPIGGVQEKIAAAARDGAGVFLLPKANCVDALESHPGLRLVPVENIGDALEALESLNDPAAADSVPQCQ